MAVRDDKDPVKLSRFEVLGAWLRLWTPPRGAAVPPVPWRAIVAGGLLLLALAGAGAALLVPRIADERREAREREQRIAQQRRAEFLAYVEREEKPRTAQGTADPGRETPAAQRRAVRAALLATAEERIGADAGRRTGKTIRGVDCSPFPSSLGDADLAADLSLSAAAYDCVAVTARFGGESTAGGEGVVGIPFRLVARFRAGTLAWCRIVPLSDRDRLTRRLPRPCRLRPAA